MINDAASSHIPRTLEAAFAGIPGRKSSDVWWAIDRRRSLAYSFD
jgi:hypothetical protein